MSLPVLLHSGMTGAPSLTRANGSVNAMLNACLVNGFNTQSVSSATASGGVVTFNFASAPGFDALDTVTIAGASNATVNGQFRVQSAASNQVLVAIPGVPDGAVAGTITMKFSPLGWTRPYSGTGIGCYKQGGNESYKRYLRVYDNDMVTSELVRFRGYEAMTAVSTGTGAFPTTAQVAGNGIDFYGIRNTISDTQPRQWLLVGTPRTFYLFWVHYLSAIPSSLNPIGGVVENGVLDGNYGTAFGFGDLQNVTKAGDNFAQFIPASNSHYVAAQGFMPRTHTGSGTAISDAYTRSTSGESSGNRNGRYPNPASGGLTITGQGFCLEAGGSLEVIRGFLPGVLNIAESPWANYAAGAQSTTGALFTGIPGVTGRAMLAMSGLSGRSDHLILLDEDWGNA